MTKRLAVIFGILVLFFSLGAVASLLYLDKQVTSRFEGKRWQVPARVYARPLELFSGRPLSPDELVNSLARLGYRSVSGEPDRPGQYNRNGNSLEIYSRAFDFGAIQASAQAMRVDFAGNRISRVRALDGAGQMERIQLEPEEIGVFYPKIQEDRILVKLKDVPKPLISAIVATEDRRFYEHHGVDLRGIMRAVIHNAQAGHTVEGGSTLTQQLVKNLYLSSERSLWRKLREAAMAMLLEMHYSKGEILEAYLNEIYLGQDGNRSIHGVGLASRVYFGVSVKDINLEQAALLAGMIQAPNLYNPYRNASNARKRRNEVLDKLVAVGYLDSDRAARLKRSSLEVVRARKTLGPTPAFLDLVRRQLRQVYDEDTLTADGLRVFTTIDLPTQRTLEAAISKGLPDLERRHRLPSGSLQGAGAVIHPATGEVLALVGDRQPDYAGFNRALDAVRPIGSLIKPAVYLTALTRPPQYTLASVLDDSPLVWKVIDGDWKPENYDHRFRGPVLLERALYSSLNVPTVRLGQALGLPAVFETLQALGVRRNMPATPSALLGAHGLTPLEVGQMYQTIANGGYRTPVRSIQAVYTADGKPLGRYPAKTVEAVDPRAVYLLNAALERVMQVGTGASAAQYIPVGTGLAGKTGTTNDMRDSWFAGYNRDWLGVVWVGRDDNRPAGLSGSEGALQIWGRLARDMRVRPKPIPRPAGIQVVPIDPVTGLQPGPNCLEQPARITVMPATNPFDTLFGGGEPVQPEVRIIHPDYVNVPFINGSAPPPGDPCPIVTSEPQAPVDVPADGGVPGNNPQEPARGPDQNRDQMGHAIQNIIRGLGDMF